MAGPTGRVVGVDADAAVLRTARARAEAAEAGNVAIVEGDCRTADVGTGGGQPAGGLAHRLPVRGMLPILEKQRIATAPEPDAGTLADRLPAELAAVNGAAEVADAIGAHTCIPD
ncbi:hypothetical protein [Nocardiopsis coralliicola]